MYHDKFDRFRGMDYCFDCGFVDKHCQCSLDVQSAEVNFTINDAPPVMSSELTGFKDQNPAYDYTVDSDPDATFGVADMDDVSLGKFLSRPVLIQSFNWTTAAPNLYERFNPWRDFLREPRIANRIAHYAFMRAKLKIRILINGNQFHYGRIIASYIPLPSMDYLTVDRPNVAQDVVNASQRPHIYLDPTFSSGGQLTLPFFYPKNAVSIQDEEYANLGEMVLHTINVLKHANGADDKVTINVFAWLEDVHMFSPTSGTAATLAPQSGEQDEYGTGPVSRPASVVSRIASRLTSVPMIAPYARATEIGAGAVSKIASLYGYCRPNDISTITTFRPQWGGNMVNTNVDDTAIKLSVDAKQELTVDPRTVGLSGQDELNIKSIATRESYLVTFPWNVAYQRDQKLYDLLVCPGLHSKNGAEIHCPASCFAANPFQYWRGTMKFRFQIVCSNFHKGRLRVVYEPWASDTGLDYTTNYNRIIDIAKEKDFTIEIGWNQALAFMKSISFSDTDTGHGTSVAFDNTLKNANGKISLYVVNDLTVPNSTVNNDISVNVFISAGDDIEFAAPRSIINRVAYNPEPPDPPVVLDAQSAEQIDEMTPQPSRPVQDATEHVGPSVSNTDPTNHVFFGETISSFRTLLKRYNHYLVEAPADTATGLYWWSLRLPAFPLTRGQPATGSALLVGKNVVTGNLLGYLSPAFCGWRGGIRHKIYLVADNRGETGAGGSSAASFAPFAVARSNGIGSSSPYRNTFSTVDITTNSGIVLSQQNVFRDNMSGTTSNPLSKNPVGDVEIPYYSPWRFMPTKTDSNDVTGDLARSDPGAYEIITRAVNTGDALHIHDWVATGEDFNMFFFTGAPIMYRRDTI